MRGALFENLVINEFIKERYNIGKNADLTFWRDRTGNEIDLIQTIDGHQHAYEIKSSATFAPDFFKGLNKWRDLSKADTDRTSVIYTGTNPLTTTHGALIPW